MSSEAYPDVVGDCPMGCGRTLFLGAGGHITCSFSECPRPTAVDELLDPRLHSLEHLVEISEIQPSGRFRFEVEHPLSERVTGELISCALHVWLKGQPGAPAGPGRYRAHLSPEEGWWLELEEAAGA
jgi:hypothetical protein